MPDRDTTDDEARYVAFADQHPLMQRAYLVYLSQPVEGRHAVRLQRMKALRSFESMRKTLTADPAATEAELETLDTYIRWWGEKVDAEDNQLERRRMKTRERVARWRARKAGQTPVEKDTVRAWDRVPSPIRCPRAPPPGRAWPPRPVYACGSSASAAALAASRLAKNSGRMRQAARLRRSDSLYE